MMVLIQREERLALKKVEEMGWLINARRSVEWVRKAMMDRRGKQASRRNEVGCWRVTKFVSALVGRGSCRWQLMQIPSEMYASGADVGGTRGGSDVPRRQVVLSQTVRLSQRELQREIAYEVDRISAGG